MHSTARASKVHLLESVRVIRCYTLGTLMQRERRSLRPERLQLRNFLGVQREHSTLPLRALRTAYEHVGEGNGVEWKGRERGIGGAHNKSSTLLLGATHGTSPTHLPCR